MYLLMFIKALSLIMFNFISGDVKDETYSSDKNRNSGYETNLYLYSVSIAQTKYHFRKKSLKTKHPLKVLFFFCVRICINILFIIYV